VATLLTVLSLTFLFGVLIASAQVTSDVIEDYILRVSVAEGVSAQMAWDIAKCETRFNPMAHNKQDPNGGSRGIYQFQEKTFYNFAKKYGIDNPDIWNPYQQVNLAIYILRDGGANHWFNCYQKHLKMV